MRKPLVWTGLLMLILAASAAGFYLYQYQYSQSHLPVITDANESKLVQPVHTGQMRPDFSLPDINGKLRHISEWDGRVIVLNFWATWCPPCMQEIPEFMALQDKYAKQDLQFVGIALQNTEEVTEFVKDKGINYPVLVGGLGVANLAERLGDDTGTLPYTVIIGRDKRISFIKNGRLPSKQAEQIINSLL